MRGHSGAPSTIGLRASWLSDTMHLGKMASVATWKVAWLYFEVRVSQ